MIIFDLSYAIACTKIVIITSNLSFLHVDIVALQSTWLADSGNIKEAYYLFLLWQSKKEDEMLGFL